MKSKFVIISLLLMVFVFCGDPSAFQDEEKKKTSSNIVEEAASSPFLFGELKKALNTGQSIQSAKNSLSLTREGRSVTLKWEKATTSLKNVTIIGYEVSKDNTEWIDVGNVLTYTFKNLNFGQTYRFVVRAKDSQENYGGILSATSTMGDAVENIFLTQNPVIGATYIKTAAGRLFVFGNNRYGQLGLGNTDGQITPIEITDSKIKGKIKKVNSGNFQTFIETTDNKLFVFGANGNGQLGLGDKNHRTLPVELAHHTIQGKVKKIHLGAAHGFIETTDNKLFAVGYNAFGQLGLGDTNDRTFPVEFTDPKIKGKVKNITLGYYNTFIETTDNKLFVFGYNSRGQLGLGSHRDVLSPTEITDSKIKGKIKKVHVGFDHAFIETTDDKIFVFGRNDLGALGLGHYNDEYSPVEFTDSRIKGKVKKITLGGSYTFIETTDSKLFVFGDNRRGQLGLGKADIAVLSPTEFTDSNIVGKIKKVFLGHSHTFIQTTDNKLFTFGDNNNGQLGLGDKTERRSAVELVLNLNKN